jgi:nitroimidazol reductase NimA-like FMN-containing flavoprotein (pyridoxamine 5'-phosphate oxidase superfamily)
VLPPPDGAGAETFDVEATVLSENDCLARLRSADVGRVAFDVDGRIEVFPVNYGMEGSVIVFRTGAGTKLNEVPSRPVAFEVDGWEPQSGIGWSVVARGRAEEFTTNVGRAAEHLRWAPVHPAAPGTHWHWIGIRPSEITGRRFRVPPPSRERT